MPICASCGQKNPDGFRFCGACGARLDASASTREHRKTVTVVFCDLTGSTALGESTDPETLRALLSRYFEAMREIVERHGGGVEKFIGDAVMAVFGVPLAHEDDALRACRAAVEMRDALPGLGVAGRLGVNTGEVVTGTEERLATGDAVNVAARLEQAAQAGEILIGDATLALVRDTVDAEPVAPLALKGKSEPVPASRLLAVRGGVERRFATPLVGRARELQALRDVFERALHDHSCHLVTVLGAAGVGKSRLAAEFLAGLDARIVRGGCLSYGEGITYWPVIEILKQLRELPDDDAAAPLRSLLGESDQGTSAEGIAWGFRKLLEYQAHEQPLVCVFDDLHWAEETLLELVEHVADLAHDAPILLLCLARPELLELRPSWGGGKWNATTLLLESLDAAETDELLERLGGAEPELRSRIVNAAEGNPLFLEEMLALLREDSGGQVDVPPTIQALLTARLDRLDPNERAVLERGSVEGRVFHEAAVTALADGEPQHEWLIVLVRKQLLRPDRPRLPADEAYRFRHLLIRDAAYNGLPKAMRAHLHRRFATWLARFGSTLAEQDEILGYHLEQAARYESDLGRADPRLADDAAAHLAAAGRRSLWRGDERAAANLIERALTLTRPARVDVLLELDLVQAISADPVRALAVAGDAAERAAGEGDETGAALARAVGAFHGMLCGANSVDEFEMRVQAARPLVDVSGDHAARAAHAWLLVAIANLRGRYEEWTRLAEQGIEEARLAGQPRSDLFRIATALAVGPRPADEALRTLDPLLTDTPDAWTCLRRADLLAMLDRSEEALGVAQQARELFQQQGGEWGEAAFAVVTALAGDHEAAGRHFGVVCDWLEATNQTVFLSTYGSLYGIELCRLGRYEEAESRAGQGRRYTESRDVLGQALWRRVQALVESQRGAHDEAERLAREALALTERTDSIGQQADALCDLADVLRAAGHEDGETSALQRALDLYERKMNLPAARRVRGKLDEVELTTS